MTKLQKMLRKYLKEPDASPEKLLRWAGGDRELRAHLKQATADEKLAHAIDSGVVTDHRVIGTLRRFGAAAAHVIRIEAKLERKLVRSRADVLLKSYNRILELKEPSNTNGIIRLETVRKAASPRVDRQVPAFLIAGQKTPFRSTSSGEKSERQIYCATE